MKKIFSILLLFTCFFAHSQIGQFSPIWTYTGSNIQYTNGATLTSSLGVNTTYTNSLTNFNLIHGTSSISLGSQSAGNPALWLGGGADATNYSLAKSGSNLMLNTGGANLYFQTGGGGNRGTWNSTGLRIGSGSNPTAVLDVTGDAKVSSTFSLGSANLTGGNTGTVAVLDDAIWTVSCMHNNSNPGDGTTVYFGTPVLGLPSTTATHYTISVPKNSTLIGYEMVGYINTTIPTAETATMSVRVNNTTDILLNNAITYTVGSGFQQYSSQALNTNVSAGDYFNIKVQYPNYVTNPGGLAHGVILKFKLR